MIVCLVSNQYKGMSDILVYFEDACLVQYIPEPLIPWLQDTKSYGSSTDSNN